MSILEAKLKDLTLIELRKLFDGNIIDFVTLDSQVE